MRLTDKVVKLINIIVEDHSSSKKTFGYLDKKDLEHEIWVICLDILKNYNKSRGELENFLRVAVKTRLINKFKDITKSVKLPCLTCPFYDASKKSSGLDCTRFGVDKHLCDKWNEYKMSVQSRNSLLNATEPKLERETNRNALDSIIYKEYQQRILDHLPDDLKNDFAQFLGNRKLSRQKFKKLRKEIMRIIEEYNIGAE
jgi:hypothetical protein